MATFTNSVWSVGFFNAAAVVRCEDAHGALLARPLPEGQRKPIDDAPEPCPVCVAVAWVQVDHWVVCERCGHRAGIAVEHEDGWSFRAGEFEDDEAEDLWLRFDDDWRQQLAEHLAVIDFPVYAVPGHVVSVGPQTKYDMFAQHEYPAAGEDVDPHLSVITAPLSAPLLDAPCDDLTTLIELSGDWQDRSLGGQLIAYVEDHRAARRLATEAEAVVRELVIDGRPEPFELIAVGEAWVATREHGETRVIVSARHVDPDELTLEPIVDVTAEEPATATDLRNRTEQARREAAGELLTRTEVEALIERYGLFRQREAVLAAIRPGFWLMAGECGRHHLGGTPDLAPAEVWPHDQDGAALTFVGQIDCSALPAVMSEFPLPEWDHDRALLRCFVRFDGEQPGAVIVLACPAGTPVQRAEPASEDVLPEQSVRLVPFLSAGPRPLDAPEHSYSGFALALGAGARPPEVDQWYRPHLLAHSDTHHDADPSGNWGVLLAVPEHPGLSTGFAIMIRNIDLAAGRYQRLVGTAAPA